MPNAHIEQVLVALRRVIRATDLHSRDLIRTSGLTAPQLMVLQRIAATPNITVGDLAAMISLSQATVSSILDRLEVRELVKRSKSRSDKRKVLLQLTRAGRKAVKDAPIPLQDKFVERFCSLQDWEQTHILSALQRIAQMMDARDLDASPVLDIGPLDRDDVDPA